MAANTLIVKITCNTHGNTEIRRFTTQADALSWAYLAKRVSELFELKTPFKLSYTDDEDDRITLSSDAELADAVGLALSLSPAVLRLTVAPSSAKATVTVDAATDGGADAVMRDAGAGPDARSTADAGTHAKPSTANAACGGGACPNTNFNTNFHPPCGGAEEANPLLASLAAQLPALLAQLPPSVRHLIPTAELDVAATLAANAAANAPAAAAAAQAAVAGAVAAAHATQAQAANGPADANVAPGVHVGVTCDKSGMCPIVGVRYHLSGHNYDVCEAEYLKLDEREKALFEKIPPPAAAANNNNNTAGSGGEGAGGGVHPGVECDRSGMCPIVGTRYNLRGHNYDLCQAEYDKLSAGEKLLYTPIPPPAAPRGPAPSAGGPWRGGGGGGCGWGRGPWAGGRGGWNHGFGQSSGGGCPFMGGGGGGHGGGPYGGGGPKLAARFVRDVSIFDGTQMAPSTKFTKIWRLKNVGEVPWPAGARMLYVGGDQMSSELSVPLDRGAVAPGEEVDVAVEMTAPSELGRYLGYWRLVGPHGRRKFGQRVWCHVQVVDPSSEMPALPEEEVRAALAEIRKKKAALPKEADEADDGIDGGDGAEAEGGGGPATGVGAAPPPSPAPETVGMETDVAEGAAEAKEAEAPAAAAEATAGSDSDDAFDLVTADMMDDANAATLTTTAGGATLTTTDGAPASPEAAVKEQLRGLGFADAALVDVVVAKHGADYEACARDLAASTEWDQLLDDLAEMGFENRALNRALMLKHDGNVKRTVKELVEDA